MSELNYFETKKNKFNEGTFTEESKILMTLGMICFFTGLSLLFLAIAIPFSLIRPHSLINDFNHTMESLSRIKNVSYERVSTSKRYFKNHVFFILFGVVSSYFGATFINSFDDIGTFFAAFFVLLAYIGYFGVYVCFTIYSFHQELKHLDTTIKKAVNSFEKNIQNKKQNEFKIKQD